MDTGEKTLGDRDTLGGTTGGTAWQSPERVTFGDLETLRDEGVLLAGRYRVVRRLGEGGMGSVWLAEDLKLDGKLFAIKMLPSVLAGKKAHYKQVKAEATVAMKLSHPNIATVRAFEEDEGGNPFLVMDYVDGEGLDDILAERGPLGEEETVRLLGPVAAALDYAHSQGVVHRDVKPGNIIVRKDGTPFVLDFGIAREIQETLTRMTGKMSSGTLLYMSPEQLNGDAPKAAQDVYSFAAMAYECLTGHAPFFRGAIEDQIKHKTPEPLPEGTGGALRAGIMAGLAKNANERPGSCAEVLTGWNRSKAGGVRKTWRLATGGSGEGAGTGKNSEYRFADSENRRADNERPRREEERPLAQTRAILEARGRAVGWAWLSVLVLGAMVAVWVDVAIPGRTRAESERNWTNKELDDARSPQLQSSAPATFAQVVPVKTIGGVGDVEELDGAPDAPLPPPAEPVVAPDPIPETDIAPEYGTSGISGPPPPSSGNAAELLTSAQSLLSQGSYEQARETALQALDAAPGDPAVEKFLSDLAMPLLASKRPMAAKVEYTVAPGDSLGKIAGKFNTPVDLIARANDIHGDRISVGQRLLLLDGKNHPFSVAVSKSQNILVVSLDGRFFKRYRVATGRDNSTPVGTFKIIEKTVHPTWFPSGRAPIPYGTPENELGTHWLALDRPGYGIHGTWKPENLGTQSLDGCICMANEDVEELYTILPRGTIVTITP